MIMPIFGGVDLAAASDDRIIALVQMAEDELSRVKDQFTQFIAAGKNELEKRMTERGATAIPSQTHEVKLEPQWSAYRYDLDLLKDAAKNLPEEEAAKIIRHIPEQIIPAHDEPGAAVSISALAKKYAGSEVGITLAQAQQRDSLGEKLVLKERRHTLPVSQLRSVK